jgi:hypothetical protein
LRRVPELHAALVSIITGPEIYYMLVEWKKETKLGEVSRLAYDWAGFLEAEQLLR